MTLDVFWSLNIWRWCLTVLYLGVRWLRRSNQIVCHGSESALPVYIISRPLVVIFGSYLVGWSLPAVAEVSAVARAGLCVGSGDLRVRRAPVGAHALPVWLTATAALGCPEDVGHPPKSRCQGEATTL